ncbi:hypothetical protein [Curtobacterium sp. Arg-1]|uniref:hypothetical protein n=1 Tax=Curtobacterium sp. Arg-1 TaxID=2935040 RepID=UPI0021DA69B0|nr:hypothetical protein [Curtobacterium sp. Arg-1]UXZ57092.1 hypothetical protein MXD64_13940 [Curtobacterium sp. Arg-1]
MSEAMDPQGSPSVDGGWHYEATENGVTDYAQLAINTARDRYFERWGKQLSDAEKAAKHWTVQKVVDD